MDLKNSNAINENKDNLSEVQDATEGISNNALNVKSDENNVNPAINNENKSSTELEALNKDSSNVIETLDINTAVGSPNVVPIFQNKTFKNADGSPKTLLGKEQIKKRLQSFSLMKQGIQALPLKKIIKPTKTVIEVLDDKQNYDENGEKLNEKVVIKKPPKRGQNHLDIAKAVKNEIEEIKRSELKFYLNPLLAPGMPTKTGDSFSRKELRETVRHKKRNKEKKRRSSEKERKRRNSDTVDIKMPESWNPIKEKNIEFEIIRRVKERTVEIDKYNKKDRRRDRRSDKNKTPTRKEDLPKLPIMFESPSAIRHPFIAVSANSENDTKKYPQEIIKFTESYPFISYCENPAHPRGLYLNRKQALQEVPQERANIMKNFIENNIRHLEPVTTVISAQNWYPREKYLSESEIIYDKPEISYGLSVLSQSYFDEPEDVQETTNDHIMIPTIAQKIYYIDKENPKEKVRQDSESKSLADKNINIEKSKEIVDKSKSNKGISKNENSNKDIEIDKKSKNEDSSKHKADTNIDTEKKQKIIDKVKEKEESKDQSLTPKIKPGYKKEQKHIDSENESVDESFDGTPNTDEYRSNWESDEDMINEILANETNSENETKKNYKKSPQILKKTDKEGETLKKNKERRSSSLEVTNIHRNKVDKHIESYKPDEKLDKMKEKHVKTKNHRNMSEEKKYDSNKASKTDKKSSYEDRSSKYKTDFPGTDKKTERISYERDDKEETRNKYRTQEKDSRRTRFEGHEEIQRKRNENFEQEDTRTKYKTHDKDSRRSRFEEHENIQRKQNDSFDREFKEDPRNKYKMQEKDIRRSRFEEHDEIPRRQNDSYDREFKEDPRNKYKMQEKDIRKSRFDELEDSQTHTDSFEREGKYDRKSHNERGKYDSINKYGQKEDKSKYLDERKSRFDTDGKYPRKVSEERYGRVISDDRDNRLSRYTEEKHEERYHMTKPNERELSKRIDEKQKSDEYHKNYDNKPNFVEKVEHNYIEEMKTKSINREPKLKYVEKEKYKYEENRDRPKLRYEENKRRSLDRSDRNECYYNRDPDLDKEMRNREKDDKHTYDMKGKKKLEAERKSSSSRKERNRDSIDKYKEVEEFGKVSGYEEKYNKPNVLSTEIHPKDQFETKIKGSTFDENYLKPESKNRKCENIIDLCEISSNIKSYETNQEKIHEIHMNNLKNQELSEKLDKIIKSKKINNSWSSDEATEPITTKDKYKQIEINRKIKHKDDQSDTKMYTKLRKEIKERKEKNLKKLKKKINKNHKETIEKIPHETSVETFKNQVKIDYNDYDNYLDESGRPQDENKMKETIQPRHKIKIDYSDFEHPILEDKYKTKEENSIPESKNDFHEIEDQTSPEKAEFSDGHTPEIKHSPKEIPSEISTTADVSTDITTVLNITPVSPPSTPLSEPAKSVNPDSSSKLVSEYEEFMKAVCFDSTELLDSSIDLDDSKLETTESCTVVEKCEVKTPEKIDLKTKIPEKTREDLVLKGIEKIVRTDKILDDDKSTNYSTSDDDSSRSSSDSDSSYSSDNSLPSVIDIKQEKLSDSENDAGNKKRKISISDTEEVTRNIVIKKEKFDMFEEIQNKEMLSKTNKIDEYLINQKTPEIIDIPQVVNLDEIELPEVLPENIPLPNEPAGNITTPNDNIAKPQSSTPSPVKRSNKFIPIKLLTAESRKQANITPIPVDDITGFGILPVRSSEDKHILPLELLSSPKIDLNIRKRPSNITLTISPVKKMLMDAEEEEEDFTDRFIKHNDTLTHRDMRKEKETKLDDIKKIDNKLMGIEKEISEKLETLQKDVPKINEDRKDALRNKESETMIEKGKLDERDKKVKDTKTERNKTEDRDQREEKEKKDGKNRKEEKDRREDSDRKEEKVRLEEKDKHENKEQANRPKAQDPRKKSRSNPTPEKRSLDRPKSRDRSRKDPIKDRRLSDERRKDTKRDYSREKDPRHKEPRRSLEKDRRRSNRSREREDSRRRRSRRHSRSPTPKKDSKSSHNSPKPKRISDDTDFSATSMDIVQSPVNSPLAGFKRSLADSTISDSELSRRNIHDNSAEHSPYTHSNPRAISPASPKRISLDDRINQVLGIEKEHPKPIGTVCTRGQYDTGHQPAYQEMYGYPRSEYEGYDQYGQYGYNQQYQGYQQRNDGVQVVQVGNMIQVVPTEQPPPPIVQPTLPKINVHVLPPKVVQVGNMLQIVPIAIPEEPKTIPLPKSSVSPPTLPATPVPPEKSQTVKNTEQLLKERKAEKEKRRLEREQRRQEKEKKRKEKEKRKQMKMKLKTENMIKKALLLETGELEPEQEETVESEKMDISESRITSLPWPPATVHTTVSLNKTPTKGILVCHGFSKQNSLTSESEGEGEVKKKVVKFADGICPGEGTSPSGGEELPSPPPPPRKLPKEKRYQKKLKNKKKIKVKIIRTQQAVTEEEEESEDDLPPPPPPPGSPPPHLWPPRVKPINNVHPQIPTALYPPSPFPQAVLYPPAFPPQPSPRHHMPVLPVQGGIHMHPGSLMSGVPPQHLAPGPLSHGPPHPVFHPHRHPD